MSVGHASRARFRAAFCRPAQGRGPVGSGHQVNLPQWFALHRSHPAAFIEADALKINVKKMTLAKEMTLAAGRRGRARSVAMPDVPVRIE
jgi:hypothetical protein